MLDRNDSAINKVLITRPPRNSKIRQLRRNELKYHRQAHNGWTNGVVLA